MVQQRIGPLLPDGKDHWWEVAADAEPEVLGAQVAETLSMVGPPFPARLSTAADLLAMLDADHWQTHVPGNVPLFRAMLFQNKHPDSGETVAAVQDRLQTTRAAGPTLAPQA